MKQTFNVSAMTCGHCEKAVTTAILQADPRAVVTIDRSIDRVDVISDVSSELIAQAISAAGYEVAKTP
jgi:copper chaperone